MKKANMLLAALCAVGMTASLFGCSSGQAQGGDTQPQASAAPAADAASAPQREQIVVGFSNWSRSFEFYVDLEKGMQEVADAQGVKLITQDPNGDLAAQTKQVEDFITQGVDGIVLCPIDSNAAVTEAETINQAGIPLVTTDIAVAGGDVASHIASDNTLGGQLAAQFIGEQLGGTGKVALINNPTITSLIERETGFTDTMAQKYPDIEIVAVQSGESKREKGLSVMENILQSNPDVQGVFAVNDMMGLGALQAVQAAQRDDIVIVGFDATEEAVKYIKEGSALKASVAQNPVELGKTTMETMIKVIAGEQVEKNIPVPVELVTAGNA